MNTLPEKAVPWVTALGNYFNETPIPAFSTDHCSVEQLIQFGQRTHLLEWFDYWRQTEQLEGKLSGSLVEAARQQRSQTVLRNRVIIDVMNKLDQSIGNQISYAWLKGGGVLQQGFLPRGVRRLSDLDLLIRRTDFPFWDRHLQKHGFQAHRDPDWIHGENYNSYVTSAFYHGDFDGQDLFVDLHWHLTDFPARRACGRWDFSMGPVFDQMKNHRLPAELRILYWIDHAFSHNFFQWKFIVDIHKLLQTATLDREKFNKWKKHTGYHEPYKIGCRWLNRLSEIDLGLPDPTGNKLTKREQKYLVNALNGDTRRADYLWLILHWLNPFERITFVRYLLFPAPEVIPGLKKRPTLIRLPVIYFRRLRRTLGEIFK